MQVGDFAEIVRQQLSDTNQSPHGAATSHGLPQDTIRSVLDGHVPRLDKVIDICRVLDLEIYIGKPRDLAPEVDTRSLLDEIKKRDDALLAGIRAILDRLR